MEKEKTKKQKSNLKKDRIRKKFISSKKTINDNLQIKKKQKKREGMLINGNNRKRKNIKE